MKVSGSLTAGGGGGGCFCCRRPSWPDDLEPSAASPCHVPGSSGRGVLLGPGLLLGRRLLRRGVLLGGAPRLLGLRRMQGFLDRLVDSAREHGAQLGPARWRRGRGDRPGRVDGGCRLLGCALPVLGALLGRLLGRLGQLGRLGRRRAGVPLGPGLGGGGPALGAPDGQPGREDPPHAGHRLAADQPAVVEEPGMLPVELLEGVVGQDGGAGALGDPQHERVAATDGARRRRDDLAVEHGLAHLVALGVPHAVLEGGVDHDDDAGARVLGGVRAHGLVELLEAGERSSFGGQVGPVHHDVVRFSQWHVATDRPAPTGAGRRSRWRGWPTRAG